MDSASSSSSFSQMGLQVSGEIQFLKHLFVPFKNLDGVPAQIAVRHLALDGLLDVSDGVLHAAGEHMGQLPRLLLLGHSHGLFRGNNPALTFEGGHFHDFTAQSLAQLGQIDLVAVLSHQVDHVHRHHHGQAQLDQLCG